MLCRRLIPDDLMDDRKDPIVDLAKVIEEAAWKALEVPSICGCRNKPCKRKGLRLRINWNALERRDIVESFELVPDELAIRPLQLYRTQFRNFSQGQQIFTFRAERQTQSSMELCVQEGISIGGSMNLNFCLPTPGMPDGNTAEEGESSSSEFKMTGGLLSSQVTWNHSATEKFTKTESLKWGVDSAVTLEAGQRALASLSVLEAKMVGRLRIRTEAYISLRSGLPVYAVSAKDDEVIAAVDLAANSICKNKSNFKVGDDNRSFTYHTSALVKAVYGMEQVATVRLLKPGEEDGDMMMDGPLIHTESGPGCEARPKLQIHELDYAEQNAGYNGMDAIPLIAKA